MPRRVHTVKPDEPVIEEPKTIEEEVQEVAEVQPEPEIKEPVIPDIKVGDRVTITGDIKCDTLGRKIQNSLRGYHYKVLNIRNDGIASIECLTHAFCVKLVDLTKVN